MDSIHEATGVIQQREWVKFCQLSATVLTLYDHALNFSSEVEYIWARPKSLQSVLYLSTHYLGDIILIVATVAYFKQLDRAACYAFLRWQTWAPTVLILLMQGIMLLNLAVLFRYSAKSICVMGALFAGETTILCMLLGISYSYLKVVVEPLPGIYICIPVNVPRWAPIWWIPIILFDLILSSFAVPRAWRQFRDTRHLRKSVAQTMLRDNMVYYVAILAINIANATVWLVVKEVSYEIPQCFTISVTSIFGCRMILNTRAFEEKRLSRMRADVPLSAMEDLLPNLQM